MARFLLDTNLCIYIKNYFTDPDRAEAGIRRVLNENKVTNYELTARARDGKETVVSYNATTFHDRDRNLQGVFAAARDVTERQLMDRALQETNVALESAKSAAERANLAKSDFLSSMSHELRSPLNAILGFAQLIESGEPSPTTSQKRSIDQILQAGWYLLELINEILVQIATAPSLRDESEMTDMPIRSLANLDAIVAADEVMQSGATLPPKRVLAIKTLLYVEDSPANLLLIETLMLRRADFVLLSAKNGLQGIAIAQAKMPDVILMDINLPGISGIEAMKILASDHLTRSIPVIALSANAKPHDIDRGMKAGFFRYLTKPMKVVELMSALDEALQGSTTATLPTLGQCDTDVSTIAQFHPKDQSSLQRFSALAPSSRGP